MITVYSPEHALHHPPHEWFNGALIPVHESPERAEIIRAALEQAGLGAIVPPRDVGLAPVRAVHAADYLEYLEHAYVRWVAAGGDPAAVLPDTLAVRWMSRRSENPLALAGYYASDLTAPIVAETYRAACISANVALTGAALLLEGQTVAYALCRPPGHHAGSDMCGGYSYLNNAAIAAQYLLDAGHATQDGQTQSTTKKVAILDIDYHHGNGTQQIFYQRDDVFTVSIHADPNREYPYFSGYADEQGNDVGRGYNLNLPLEEGVTDARYLAVLEQALDAMRDVAPRYLVLSAGFDTFDGDPIGDFKLSTPAYTSIGQRIAALGLPTLIVQEGGYATVALGQNVVALLRGFTGPRVSA